MEPASGPERLLHQLRERRRLLGLSGRDRDLVRAGEEGRGQVHGGGGEGGRGGEERLEHPGYPGERGYAGLRDHQQDNQRAADPEHPTPSRRQGRVWATRQSLHHTHRCTPLPPLPSFRPDSRPSSRPSSRSSSRPASRSKSRHETVLYRWDWRLQGDSLHRHGDQGGMEEAFLRPPHHLRAGEEGETFRERRRRQATPSPASILARGDKVYTLMELKEMAWRN